MNYDLIVKDKMDNYEQKKLDCLHLINEFDALLKKYDYNEDLKYYINCELSQHGYPISFECNTENYEPFDKNKYTSLVKNATKSINKTKDLVFYLSKINNHVLTLSSLKYLKVDYLVKLDLIKENTNLISKNLNNNFRDLLFRSYEYDDNTYNYCLNTLNLIGVKYIDSYFEFILSMEYLLWTIERDDEKYGFYKSNTLKVALNIAPKEYFEFNNKEYYNSKFSKVTMQYLKLIDKNAVIKVINNLYPLPDSYFSTGYKVLFDILLIL